MGTIVIHEHIRVGREFHCRVLVMAHCSALNAGYSIGRIVPLAVASTVSRLK